MTSSLNKTMVLFWGVVMILLVGVYLSPQLLKKKPRPTTADVPATPQPYPYRFEFNLASSNVAYLTKSFDSQDLKVSGKYDASWQTNQVTNALDPDYEYFELYKKSIHPSQEPYFSDRADPKKLGSDIFLKIGFGSFFSTAGSVCWNSCEKVGEATFQVEGESYTADIIKAGLGPLASATKDSKSAFRYYAFTTQLKGPLLDRENYRAPTPPGVTAYFFTPEEGQEIVNILSTLTY